MGDTGFSDEVESEPAIAAAIFGDRLASARQYVRLLAGPGTVRGLIGPREAGRLWSRHVLNCALAARAIPAGARLVDIGSGAGLPGIPIALARPDLSIDLVETLHRRAVFLEEAIAELDLSSTVRAIRGRAEDAVGEVGGADAVTSRAVAPLARLALWCAPLLRADGLFIALKGRSAADEVARDEAAAARAGIVDLHVKEITADVVEPTIVVLGRRDQNVGRGVGALSAGKRSRATDRPRGSGASPGRRSHGPDRDGIAAGSRRGSARGK